MHEITIKKKVFESSFTESKKEVICHQNHLLSYFCISRWAALSNVIILEQQTEYIKHLNAIVLKQ